MTPTPITYHDQSYNQRKHDEAQARLIVIDRMLRDGKPLAEIAQAVGLSERTVSDHVKRLKKGAK